MRVISVSELHSVAGGAAINGCTGVPDQPFGYDFKPACDRHDVNYSTDTLMSKAQADQAFRDDMLNICKTQYNNDLLCRATAEVYYIGVTIFGGAFYEGSGGFSSSSFDGGGGFSSSGFSF